VLVSSSTISFSSAPVPVGIDQLTHCRLRDPPPGCWNDQSSGLLSKAAARDGLDSDSRAVELEFDLTTADQADPIAE
jgi:hypothetical protein